MENALRNNMHLFLSYTMYQFIFSTGKIRFYLFFYYQLLYEKFHDNTSALKLTKYMDLELST